MKKQYISVSISETRKIAKELARHFLKQKKNTKAIILGLEGDLGGGKTTFLQGFAKGLGIRSKILSPTFVILKKFKIRHGRFKFFYHIDCYRVKQAKEIIDLGFEDIASDPRNIIAVEWADRIRKILPKNKMILKFKFIDKNKRKITIE
jgi:tRNA threonylcarbamoyladenosine biosynthesis protein TsaE